MDEDGEDENIDWDDIEYDQSFDDDSEEDKKKKKKLNDGFIKI